MWMLLTKRLTSFKLSRFTDQTSDLLWNSASCWASLSQISIVTRTASRKTSTGWNIAFFGNGKSEKKSWQDHLNEHHASQDRGLYKFPSGDLYSVLSPRVRVVCEDTVMYIVPTYMPQHSILQRDLNQLRSQNNIFTLTHQVWPCKTVVMGSL